MPERLCLYIVPSTNLVKYGRRSFAYAGPKLWNESPHNIRECKDLTTFKSKLDVFIQDGFLLKVVKRFELKDTALYKFIYYYYYYYYYQYLADRIAQKDAEPYHIVITWIRTLISFELLRSVHTCVRGSRTLFRSKTEQSLDRKINVASVDI